MARVLFIVPMDAERRAALARKETGAFEPVILEGWPPEKRDEAWATADVVVSMGVPREFPLDFREKARKVRMIQSLVAGVDHFPFERFPPSAIVCSNAGAYSISVAEHAMALLLAAAKDVAARTEEIRRGIFHQTVENKGLAGSTALIIGFGGIGSEVARRCKAFDMHVVGVARSRPSKEIADAVGTMEDLPRYLPEADAVFLALPLTRATHGLVDRGFLARMKEGARWRPRWRTCCGSCAARNRTTSSIHRTMRSRPQTTGTAEASSGRPVRIVPTTSSTIFKSGRLYSRPPSTSVGCSGACRMVRVKETLNPFDIAREQIDRAGKKL